MNRADDSGSGLDDGIRSSPPSDIGPPGSASPWFAFGLVLFLFFPIIILMVAGGSIAMPFERPRT